MFSYQGIRELHLEITSYCNASCPMCKRNVSGGKVNPNLHQTQLTLQQIQEIMPADFIKGLDLVYFCGNYWDPSMGRDTIDIISHFKKINPNINVSMYTNGSTRDVEWWSRLAKVIDYCQFDVDWLQDTNHIYRRGTNWQMIMDNMWAFIGAGGNAGWEFIVFSHNEHQIEEARAIATEMGITNFVVKKTSRFLSSDSGAILDKWEVLNKKGQLEYEIKPTSNPHFRNNVLEKFKELNYAKYLDSTPISCKALKDKSIYISADWNVFPCCWMGHIYNRWVFENEQVIASIGKDGSGLGKINLFKLSLSEILWGLFFRETLTSSWKCPSIKDGKMRVCSRVCGTLDIKKAQFEESLELGLHAPGWEGSKQ